MGISKRNPRGNFNWQSRILKKKAICCGQLNEPVDCNLFGPTLEITGNNICKPLVGATGQNVVVFNTQPGQANTTLYEWYEGGPGGPLYYSSYGGASSIEVTAGEQIPGTITYWLVVTNEFNCVTSQYLDIYVTNIPEFTITEIDPIDPCAVNPSAPFGQQSNGEITVTLTNPDPNVLYYEYIIEKGVYQYTVTTTDTSVTWDSLCFGRYYITVKVYRDIDGTPTLMCTEGPTLSTLGYLILTWDDILNVPVADPNDVSLWNNWLSPGFPPDFTTVTVIGNRVYLKGAPINLVLYFSVWNGNTHIVMIEDQLGYVLLIDNFAFTSCTALISVKLQEATQVGQQAFFFATALQEVIMPNCKDIRFGAFTACNSLLNLEFPTLNNGSPGIGPDQLDNLVFKDVVGATITVTVPVFFQTSNAGGLEGDLAYLNTNNTVTFIWV